MDILLCIFLVVLGIFDISMGVIALAEKDFIKGINKNFFLIGLGGCIWCLGYGFMGISYISFWAYLLRAIALIGVYMTVIFILNYMLLLSGVVIKRLKLVFSIVIWGGLISYILVALPMSVSFVKTIYGNYYIGNPWIGRFLQYMYFLVIIVFWFVISISWYKKAKRTRYKKMAVYTIWGGVVIVLGMVFDTILPMFGQAAFPSSAISTVIFIVILRKSFRDYNAMSVASINLSEKIIHTIATPVLIMDDNYKVIECNDAAAEYLASYVHYIEGSELSEWVNGFDAEQRAHLDAEFYNKTKELKLRLEAKGNRNRFIMDASFIYDAYDEPLCVVCILEDLTKIDELTEQVELSNKNNAMANAAKKTFISFIEDEVLDNARDLIEKMRENGVDESTLVKSQKNYEFLCDLRELAVMSAGDYSIDAQKYDFLQLLETLVKEVSEDINESEVKFITNISPVIPQYMIGDERVVRKILSTFLKNATEYTKNGTIMLQVGCRIRFGIVRLQFIVSDTGLGMQEEDIDMIFGTFATEGNSDEQIIGTGVSLTVCRNLIRMMNGEISVKSALGSGTTFSFNFEQKMNINSGIIPYDDFRQNVLILENGQFEAESTGRMLSELGIAYDTVISGNLSETELPRNGKYTLVLADARIVSKLRQRLLQMYPAAKIYAIYSFQNYKKLTDDRGGLCRPLLFSQLESVLKS